MESNTDHQLLINHMNSIKCPLVGTRGINFWILNMHVVLIWRSWKKKWYLQGQSWHRCGMLRYYASYQLLTQCMYVCSIWVTHGTCFQSLLLLRRNLISYRQTISRYTKDVFLPIFSIPNIKPKKFISIKTEGPLWKMLNSPADGTHAGGLKCLLGPSAWSVNSFSTIGHT